MATRITPINMLTKQYNPYIDKGKNFSVNKIDFAVQKTSVGKIDIDYTTSSSVFSTILNSAITVGTNELETFPYPMYPFEQLQTRLWHTMYFDTQGECIQLKIYQSPAQIVIGPPAVTDPLDVVWSDFQLEGMMLYVQPTGRVE
jgi:hypothetical protein